MFAQYVFLVALIAPALSEFTIQQEHYGHDCIDVSCPKGSFKQISHPLIKDNSKEVQCTICSQCTDYGFSVCSQFRLPSLRFKREDNDGSTCTCANSVPAGCRISDNQSREKKDPNSEIIHVCYLSTLRTPPRPLALNQKQEVIASLEEFWLESYWKEFELSNLTLFYEFEVKSPEDCDEIGNVTTFEGSENPHVCTSSLVIHMDTDDTTDESQTKPPTDPTDNDDEDYEEDGEDRPPEVEFARNVFAGAKTVKLWYTVVVKRPRQLNLLKGEHKIQDITTLLSSETLKFDLEPEIYEKTDEKEDDDDKSKDDGHDKVDKVGIEEKTDAEEDEDDGEDSDVSEYNGKEPEEDQSAETTETPSEEVETTTEQAEEEEEETSTAETTDITEDGSESSEETTEIPTVLDDDSAVNETATFFETHFGNWPLVRVGFVLTFVACVLIIAAGCCYKYRGCCCYSDRQKMATKSSNGYEYHVTGQEMVAFCKTPFSSGETFCIFFQTLSRNIYPGPTKDPGSFKSATFACFVAILIDISREFISQPTLRCLCERYAIENHQMNKICTPVPKAVQSGIVPTEDFRNAVLVDENVLDATIRELQGIAESANVGDVLAGLEREEDKKIDETNETQNLIEPESDNQDIQNFHELMRISPRLWPCRLRIDALVGTGQFGNIHKGLLIDSDRGTTHDVAVFSVKKIDQTNEKELASILNTFAETVKAGLHPNIISLLAVQQQPDRLLIVLDSLFYPDLLNVLRESRVTRYDNRLQKKTATMIGSDRLISMMLGCVYGCGHLIRHGITHPMLAATNVLVVGRALVKISGFGFANHRLLRQKQFESRPTKQRWLPPEYFVREYASPNCGQSNIWSLGVLLWEIASLGGTPYAQFPTPEAFQERIREKAAFLQPLSYCSGDFQAIIEQCCTYDREDRPDMTDVIARKLEQLSIDPEKHIDITVKDDNFNYSPVEEDLILENEYPVNLKVNISP
uniref:Protein kinase domain-containing protein n=1 Tax=Panagrolaimus sp. JU765 TaxID=591449 RepID=A0AC34PUR4_9BILA